MSIDIQPGLPVGPTPATQPQSSKLDEPLNYPPNCLISNSKVLKLGPFTVTRNFLVVTRDRLRFRLGGTVDPRTQIEPNGLLWGATGDRLGSPVPMRRR